MACMIARLSTVSNGLTCRSSTAAPQFGLHALHLPSSSRLFFCRFRSLFGKPVPLLGRRCMMATEQRAASGDAGEPPAGEPSGGEPSAGELSAGEPVPAETSAGFLTTPAQQTSAYRYVLMVFAVMAAMLSAAPEWCVKTGLGVEPTPLLVGMQGVCGSYMWLAVACAAVLREAASHGRLSSDTYKRLNLGLILWPISLLLLLLPFFTVLPLPLVCGSAAVVLPMTFVCSKLYTWSNAGALNVGGIVSGAMNGAKGLFAPKSAVAAGYALLTLIYIVSFVLIWGTDQHPLFLGTLQPIEQYMKRQLGAGMLLAGIVHYVQFDAANRGRLGASTFKLLNIAVAMYSVVGTYYFWTMYYAGVAMWQPLLYFLLAMGVASAVFCDVQYFVAK